MIVVDVFRNYAKSWKTFHYHATSQEGGVLHTGIGSKTESTIQFPKLRTTSLNSREMAIKSILNQVKEQNTSTLEIEFDRNKNRDLSYIAVKAVRLMSVNTLVSFWMNFVMSNSSRMDQLDIHAHTAAMSALNRYNRYHYIINIYSVYYILTFYILYIILYIVTIVMRTQ